MNLRTLQSRRLPPQCCLRLRRMRLRGADRDCVCFTLMRTWLGERKTKVPNHLRIRILDVAPQKRLAEIVNYNLPEHVRRCIGAAERSAEFGHH
jgi:hypothetical protein